MEATQPYEAARDKINTIGLKLIQIGRETGADIVLLVILKTFGNNVILKHITIGQDFSSNTGFGLGFLARMLLFSLGRIFLLALRRQLKVRRRNDMTIIDQGCVVRAIGLHTKRNIPTKQNNSQTPKLPLLNKAAVFAADSRSK